MPGPWMIMHRLQRLRLGCAIIVMLFTMSSGFIVAPVAAQEPLCFNETGQCIDRLFRAYWQQNGGLEVFGYPLTPANEELNRDTGRTFLTQWFERNRLEWHPENPAPYDVLLGRLGDDRLLKLGHDWRNSERERGPKPGCQWFEQTGYNVCDQQQRRGFRTYWQQHGLRDPRLDASSRSLALFGLPVTEARVETNASGDTVLTQWFERARFEWHPEKSEQFRVLLGLVGNEAHASLADTRQPSTDGIFWSADHETGDVTQWQTGDGGGVFNTGTGEAVPTTEVAHSGRHALALRIHDAAGTHQATRLFRWQEAQTRDAAYYSVWYYFPRRTTVPTWWNVFQWKSRRDLNDPATNDPTWIVGVENRSSGAMHFVLEYWPEQRSRVQTVKDIPEGRWTHLEAYIEKATDASGRVTVWQDGVLLFEVEDVRTANSADFSWSVNNYAEQLVPHEATIFVDDAVISTRRIGP